jgi:histidine triad (HIT) family protein
MAPCAFCQIASGERDAYVLYEDAETMAFLDSDPAVQGHTLVVPKTHREDLFLDEESSTMAVLETVQRVVRALERTVQPDGISLFYTSGDIVGRVTHAHVHLLPRYEDDDIHLSLARDSLEEDEAAHLAARLTEHL